MKGNYTKPLFAVEMFSSTQPVTRDCADSIPKDRVNMNDIATCVRDLGGGTTVFGAGKTCVLDGEGMGIACYNNPGEGQYIFKS